MVAGADGLHDAPTCFCRGATGAKDETPVAKTPAAKMTELSFIVITGGDVKEAADEIIKYGVVVDRERGGEEEHRAQHRRDLSCVSIYFFFLLSRLPIQVAKTHKMASSGWSPDGRPKDLLSTPNCTSQPLTEWRRGPQKGLAI